MTILPEKFMQEMESLLGEEYASFIKSMNDSSKRYYGLRTNGLKIISQELKQMLSMELKDVSWCDTGFYYNENQRPAKSPLFRAGLYYIQEPSAMSAASVLPIKDGDRVLDVCAAPGGKTTQLGVKLANTGVLVSNDVSGSRCIALNKNIELMGIKNCVVTNEEPEKLKRNFMAWFDKILIDAPCSGEGMFRKDNDAVKGWLNHPPEKCIIIQKNILNNCAEMLKKGGIILYSTCTFNPNENELMIKNFLDSHDGFEIIDIEHEKFGFDRGRAEWADNDERLLGCARIWPHKCDGEGHFMALLKKTTDQEDTFSETKITKEKKIDGLEYFDIWCNKYLFSKLDGNIKQRKNALYLEPLDMPNLHGIRAYKTGLYLGDLKPKRFEPSLGFALALKKEEFKNIIDFGQDSQEVFRYLNGESFDVEANEGYNLFCVNGYPLGFAKVVNGRLKNRPM